MASETKLCLLLLIISPVCICGDYIILVRSIAYSNPSNRCFQCQLGCCDRFFETNCTGTSRCDNQFTYCLQPIGSNTTCSPQAISGTVWDDGSIDFTQATVLGLPNPLPLNGVSLRWKGAELYIAVMDDDSNSPINLPNDLIDDFLIPIDDSLLPVNLEAVVISRGRNNFAQIALSIRVTCAPDFTGEQCESTIDDCIGPLSNCSENGQCVDGIGTFTCDCQPGYTGQYCETNIDECLTMSLNCSNNGICNDGINNFMCECNPGFTGDLCQEDIDDCVSVECNSGLCQDRVNGFSCNCDPGFEGVLCAIDINECANIDCSGRGMCIDGVNSFTCDCDSGYTGLQCETNIDDCEGVSCSGNRYCLDGVNSYECVCNASYTGINCNIHVSQLRTIMIAGPIGGALFVFLILLCLIATTTILFRRVRQKRKRKDITSWLQENKARYETSAPFLLGDREDQSHLRETNIYASITHNDKVVNPVHHDDLEIHYWNENYRAPPIKPSFASKSIAKQSSDEMEDSMYLNPLYDGSAEESKSAKVTTGAGSRKSGIN